MLPTRFRTSLIHRLFLSIWGLFLVLLLLLSLLGYVALRLATDSVTPLVLQRMVQLKAQSNEGLFLQADISVRRLRMALLRRLEDVNAQHGEQRFQELFARSPDGLWRVRPELLDTERAPTLYLHAGDQGLSASARQRAVASYELLREQGPALTPPFFSAYMDFVEDGLMVFARGIDWGGNANAQSSNINYPTMLGADPRRNPDRKVFWTPVYLDEQAHTWMVSVIAPLDWKGRWVGTLGHDVAMASLIDSVTGGQADLGQQLILDGRGHLIAHPDWGERITAAQGQLSIAELQDQVLDELQQLMQQTPGSSGAGRIAAGRQWAAWSRIRGPNWYQVILLPQERVNRELRLGLAAVVGLGFLVLVPGLWWLRRRVRVLVARPLQRLTLAVDELARGHDPIPIGLVGDNELGRLAAAFDTMAADLTQQRAMQAAHARTLQGEVDERRQVMQRLQQERARLLALLGAMHQGILFVDTQQQVSYCNATYRDLWCLPASLPIVGQPLAQLLPASLGQITLPERLTQYLQLQPGLADVAPLELLLKDGRTLLLAIHPVHDSQGGAMGYLWVCEDVTQQRETAQQLITLAERDALTGLFNRRRFEQELERFFHESTRQPSPPHQAAVLFFDLDEFKYINDRFGHGAGDAVLLRVAGAVKGLVRDTDVLSRLGGDEFAIFMPHASLDSAQLLAERVVRAVASTALHIEGHNLRLTTSLGIAHFPLHASSAQELVAHADTAMYQAKHLGKNRFSVYHPDRDIAETMVARLAWNERIERALAGGLLRLHSQGVYYTQSGHLAHLEALVRMVDENDPTQLIGPSQFIAHAEKSGKILDIDRWVLRESIRLLAEHPGLPAMAVNISGRSIDDPELPGFITAQLAGQGVAPQRLLLELTETAAVSDLGDAQRFIDELQRAGCTLCLDDFGTGFASFAYLKHLQAQVLKIDGLFVRNLPREPDNQVFVRSIIEVAHGMGKRAVAECVEDEQTLELLRGFGVDMVQGYHLDRPQAAHPGLHGDGV